MDDGKQGNLARQKLSLILLLKAIKSRSVSVSLGSFMKFKRKKFLKFFVWEKLAILSVVTKTTLNEQFPFPFK